MPKPSLIQRALRQPTRSYADPYAASPWADPYDDNSSSHTYSRPSHYQPVIDRGSHLGYREREKRRDGPEDAGPSRPRRAVSTISDQAPRSTSSMSTRFPKPAKKVASTIELRETRIVERNHLGDLEKPVRRKKTKSKKVDEYSEASSSPGVSFTSAAALRRMKNASINDDNSSLASDPSISTLPSALRHRAHASESSSARSSPVPPATPALPPQDVRTPVTEPPLRKRRPSASVLQPNVVVTHIAPLTPPQSDSSLRTSTSSERGPARVPKGSPLGRDSGRTTEAPPSRAPEPVVPAPRPRKVSDRSRDPSSPTGRAGSESEEEVFYTPRQSLASPTSPVVKEPEVDAASQETTRPVAPVLSLQPPTPAAVEDLASSPLDDNDSPSGKVQASLANMAPAIDSPPIDDDERHSLHPEVGSDSEGEAEQYERPMSQASYNQSHSHSRQSSRSQPHSRNPSFTLVARPASRTGSMVILQSQRTSMLDDHRGLTRPSKAKTSGSPSIDDQQSNSSSRRTSFRSMGDFKVLRRNSGAVSERSFGARSDATPASGYGKGGWAAAHASSRSIAAPSPVKMLMPTGGNDGWAEHQRPVRSKFTPLPSASQTATFENLRITEDLAAAKQHDDEYTSPSDYSMSDAEALPKPSRSYAKQSSASYSYDRGSDGSPGGDSGNAHTSRDYVSNSPVSSIDPYASYRERSDAIRADSPHRHRPASAMKRDSRPPSAMERYSRSSSSGNASGSRRLHSRENSFQSRSTPPSGLSRPTSPIPSEPPSPPMSRPGSPMSINTQRGFEAPSFLNPDTLTLLPEMTIEDSSRTYEHDPIGDAQRKAEAIRRTRSSIYSKSIKSARSVRSAKSDDEGDGGDLHPRRAKSAMGHRPDMPRWEGSSAGEGVLVQSNGLDQAHNGGYTTLILPTGAYQPTDPSKSSPSEVNSRVLGLPHATMAALVLSSSTHRVRSDTPAHLRSQLPPPVDFSSHLKPPTKVNDSQILVQVYAVAIDGFDLAALDVKSRADVGKWVPGRSFVGRCLQVGSYEKELVRGDLVMGLMDVRKSGALAEYIVCDRRRLARTPFPSQLTLEQMSLLPLQGLPTVRAIRGRLARQTRALICDPHRGVTALMCQELSRAGTHVTALIPGGEDHHSAQSFCMLHGAKGVLTGRPATVMNQLEEGVFDLVIDTQGGQWVYDAAKRILKDGGKLITLVPPEQAAQAKPENIAKPSGLKSLKAAFRSTKRQTSKTISFEYLPPAGSGEAEVDASGLDIRDVLEEPTIVTFKPVVTRTVPLEKGNEAFRGVPEGVVVRIIH